MYTPKTMARELSLPKKLTLKQFRRRQRIAASLKKLREDRGLTVMEIAVAADVSFSTWTRWENGKSAIPLELVPEINRALKSDVIPTLQPFLNAA